MEEEQIRRQKEMEEYFKKIKEEEEKERQKILEENKKIKEMELNRIEKEKELLKIKEQNEQERLKKQMEEQQKIQKEIIEQQKLQRQMEEKQKLQKQFDEQQKIQREMEEKQKLKRQMEEQQRIQKEKEEQLRIQKELLLKEQKENELKKKKEFENKIIITCKSFKKPPLIGLENIGSTCYMNATLQCFSQTELLTNYFLNENNTNKIYNNNIAKENPNSYQLSPSYLNLINNLWKAQNKKSFPPTEFRKKLANMNPLFKEGLPNDAKDLVTYILTQLHTELNLNKKNNIFNMVNNDSNAINQYDENSILQNFISSFFSENSSVLSDHFYGIQESKFICTECQKKNMNSGKLPIKYNFQTFNFLIFPLEEVRLFRDKKFAMNNMNNMNMFNPNINQFMNPMGQFQNNLFINNNFFIINQNNNNVVNIYDCFDYFQKEELFVGENAMWCNECNGLFPTRNQTFIYTGPNILILILNRGVGIQFKIKLEYYESIDLNKYIIQKDIKSMIYDLYGVVTHLGESGDSGHFVASCKSPCDNKWYRYNDSIVFPINHIKSEIIDFGTSYILFYQKRK